jgi:hypothetical protein
MPSNPNDVSQRLDRVEAILERFAEESASFQLAVRGAITAQQEQIAENSRQIRELAEITRENSRNWEQLRREFEAYLRRFPQ